MQMIWQTEVNNCNLNQNWLNRKIVFPFRLPFLSLLIPHVAQLEVPKEMKMGLRKGWIARGQRRYNLCCSVVFDFFTCLHLFHWRPFPIALQGVVDVSPRPRSRLHLRSFHPPEIPGIILATSRFVHFGFRLLSQSMSCHLILELEPAKSGHW